MLRALLSWEVNTTRLVPSLPRSVFVIHPAQPQAIHSHTRTAKAHFIVAICPVVPQIAHCDGNVSISLFSSIVASARHDEQMQHGKRGACYSISAAVDLPCSKIFLQKELDWRDRMRPGDGDGCGLDHHVDRTSILG